MKKETKQIVESDEYDPHGYKGLSSVAVSILSEDYNQYKKLKRKNITEAVDEDHVRRVISRLDVEDREALKRVYDDIQSDIIPQNMVVRAVANVLRIAGVSPMNILNVVEFITSDPFGFEDALSVAGDSASEFDYEKEIEDIEEIDPISDDDIKKMDPDFADRSFEERGPRDEELPEFGDDDIEDEDDFLDEPGEEDEDDGVDRPEDYYDDLADMSDEGDLPSYER